MKVKGRTQDAGNAFADLCHWGRGLGDRVAHHRWTFQRWDAWRVLVTFQRRRRIGPIAAPKGSGDLIQIDLVARSLNVKS